MSDDTADAAAAHRGRIAKTLHWIAKVLGSIEERPGMWGAPDAIEGQVYVLVELRQILVGYDQFDVHAAICIFIEQVNGDVCPWPLWVLLREEGMIADLPRLLGDFQRWVAREWPPLSAGHEAPPRGPTFKPGHHANERAVETKAEVNA